MKVNPSKTIDELITALAYIIDIESDKENYHAWRVAILSASFAPGSVKRQYLKDIFYAGLLHDVGGVEFSHHIMHYLKRRDKASRNLLLAHPIIGAQLVSGIPQMIEAAKLILNHHEWINGKGYPSAKAGNDIPLGAQIIRLADAVDIALQTNHFHKLKELKDKLSININKEYSKKLFAHAFDILSKNKLFYRISLQSNIPLIFKEIKNKVGLMRIPSKIDSIGTTLEVLAQIIDMKHPYTAGHSLRIAHCAMSIALAMNLDHDKTTRIEWAGLLHDFGKLSVSRKVLDKPTNLTKQEFAEIKKHPLLTKKILDMVPSLKELTPIAVAHHERFDGSGYPYGLKGKEISQGARILGVCDAFDAMTSNRPYRKPLSPQTACKQIKKFSGKQFDPQIVKYALPIFRNL